jgi:hypothetical protein
MRHLHYSPVGFPLDRQYRVPLCRVSARHLLCFWTTSLGARALGMLSNSTGRPRVGRIHA